MTWRPQKDEPKYPKGYPEIMDRDGGLYNAWWQRGGNQLQEFIEKDHLYRAKFSAPPEWMETVQFKDVDEKFAKLQLLKNTDFRRKIKRRPMLEKSTERARSQAGSCTVLSDGDDSDESPSRLRTSELGQIVPSAVLGSGGSSSVSKLVDSGVGGRGAGGASGKAEEVVSDAELARRKSTREAAADRRKYKERGSKGTYKFGQDPTKEDLKYLNKTLDERAAKGKSGTYRFDDKCDVDYSQKWPEKPANALKERLPPDFDSQHEHRNWNDPNVLNDERRVRGKKTEKKEIAENERRRLADEAANNSAKKMGTTTGATTDHKQKLPDSSGIKVDVAQELWYLDPLPVAGRTGSSAPSTMAKAKKKSDATQLLPGALDAEAWVKQDGPPAASSLNDGAGTTALGGQSTTSTKLRGSALYTQHIKVPKHLRKELLGMKKGGPLLPHKALQRLTTYSDLDYSLLRTDMHEEVKKSGEIKQYEDRHPYFRKGQRSRFYNNSNRVAERIHAGAAENFPGWEAEYKTYPGFPFRNEADGRERGELRKFVGEDTFLAWDKPLVSEPKERVYQKPSESTKKLQRELTKRTQPQKSDAFAPDNDSEPGY